MSDDDKMDVAIEKLVGLGGDATTEISAFQPVPTETGIAKIIEYENEALDALHRIIPETGQEARSEALEHLESHGRCRGRLGRPPL